MPSETEKPSICATEAVNSLAEKQSLVAKLNPNEINDRSGYTKTASTFHEDSVLVKSGTSTDQTMQLSLAEYTAGKPPLQNYPSGDALALMLILGNLPSLLITTIQFMFSMKHHGFSKASKLTGWTLPISIILAMDIVVALSTSLTFPAALHIFLDISYAIIATNISGTSLSSSVPVAIIFSVIRITWFNKTFSLHYCPANTNGTSPPHSVSTWSLSLPSSWRGCGPTNFSSMEIMKCIVAIHICMFSLFRLLSLNYLNSKSEPESGGTTRLRKKNHHTSESCRSSSASLWEQLLRLRVDGEGKRHELTQLSSGTGCPEIWIADISSRDITISIGSQLATEPGLTVHVNGLAWEAKVVSVHTRTLGDGSGTNGQAIYVWDVLLDNLSAKTEYDLCVNVNSSDGTACQDFNICTATSDVIVNRLRGDSSALPPIQTNMSDEKTLDSEVINHVAGPLSPITTLEESIATAHAKLEERKLLLKKTRKDNSKRIQQLQREFDHIAFKVHGSSDKNEQRLQGRILSLQTEIKRIQEQTDEMENEKLELANVLAAQSNAWVEQKQRRDYEADILDQKRIMYNSVKAAHEKRLNAIEMEAAKTKAKADKLSLKRTKIQQDLDRVSQEQDDILHKEYLSRNQAREVVKISRLQAEAEYLKMIHELQHRAEYQELYG